MNKDIRLYSAWYCPFAQRAWMALLKKDIRFEYIETDPYDKNSQWMAVSKGAGQVPVMIDGDLTLTDSCGILTYLDNRELEEPKLTNAGYWMDLVNTKVIPYFYRFLKAQTASEQISARDKMLEGLSLFSAGISDIGPYFSGPSIDSVDLAFIPFAYRIKLLLKYYRNFSLDHSDLIPAKYHLWYEHMITTDLFNKTSLVMPDYESRLIEFYRIYSEGGGQTDVTDL